MKAKKNRKIKIWCNECMQASTTTDKNIQCPWCGSPNVGWDYQESDFNGVSK